MENQQIMLELLRSIVLIPSYVKSSLSQKTVSVRKRGARFFSDRFIGLPIQGAKECI